MSKITFSGLGALQAKLKQNCKMEDVKRIVKTNGAELQQKAVRNAPVGTPASTGKPGYVGGTLKRSIKAPTMKDGGLTAEVKAGAEYAAYVEFGTRYMAPRPYMRPAFEAQKQQFKSDMKKLVR